MNTRIPWVRLGSFAILPLISVLSPLVIIPAVGYSLGPDAWAAVAIGQSLGLTAAIVVNFSWSVVGPTLVASSDASSRVAILLNSIWIRLSLCIPMIPIAMLTALALAPEGHEFLAVTMAGAATTAGLTSNWYFIGTGQPGKIAVFDTIPRVLSTGLAVVPIVLWGIGWIYPAAIVLSTIFGVLGSIRSVAGKVSLGRRPTCKSLLKIVRRHGPLTLSSLVTSGYTSFTIPLVSIASASATSVVAPFAGSQRLMNIGQSGIGAIISALQGWVVEPEERVVRHRRMASAVIGTSCIGIVGGFTLGLGLPLVDQIVFGPAVQISQVTAIFTGVAFAEYVVTASLVFYVLIPFKKLNLISFSTTIATIIGVPELIWLSNLFGADGAAVAVASAEFIVMAFELPIAILLMKNLTNPVQVASAGGHGQRHS